MIRKREFGTRNTVNLVNAHLIRLLEPQSSFSSREQFYTDGRLWILCPNGHFKGAMCKNLGFKTIESTKNYQQNVKK